MRELLREVAVVRENEQAFALRVETTDMEEPRKFRRQQIENRIACVRVLAGGDKPFRFVQQNVNRPFWPNEFAIYLNVIAFVRLDTEVGANPTVNRYTASRDQFVALPPRTDTGRGEKTIEAQNARTRTLRVRFRLGKADNFRAFLPLAAFLQQLDALEAFQDIALRCDGAGSF